MCTCCLFAACLCFAKYFLSHYKNSKKKAGVLEKNYQPPLLTCLTAADARPPTSPAMRTRRDEVRKAKDEDDERTTQPALSTHQLFTHTRNDSAEKRQCNRANRRNRTSTKNSSGTECTHSSRQDCPNSVSSTFCLFHCAIKNSQNLCAFFSTMRVSVCVFGFESVSIMVWYGNMTIWAPNGKGIVRIELVPIAID